MKGKITKALLISLFLLLLLAPGIVFLILLNTDKLLKVFNSKINDLKDTEFFSKHLIETYGLDSPDLILQLINVLKTGYNFSDISDARVQLICAYLGLSLVILAIVIILVGALLLNIKWQTPRALIIALIIFWIISILGFAMLAVSQYKYQWNNSWILYLIAKIEKPEDILDKPYNPNIISKEEFQTLIDNIFGSNNEPLMKYKEIIFFEFHKPLLDLKKEAHIWISGQGIWWIFLLQSGLISLIVVFDYTSYASHLVKPTYSFIRRDKILLFGQNWFKKLWASFKQPTIWNILRISILVISLLILIEVIAIIMDLSNSKLRELYKMLTVFPYSPFDKRVITSESYNFDFDINQAKTDFLENILLKTYYDTSAPSVYIIKFLPILGLSFLVIAWVIYFVLIKRISYLSLTSIILFYVFFLPLIIVSLLLFVYAQTFNNTLLQIINNYIKEFNDKNNTLYKFNFYTSTIFGEKISNMGEWILFALKVVFVLIFSIIIFILLWKIHKKEMLKKKKNIPSFIKMRKRKDRKIKNNLEKEET